MNSFVVAGRAPWNRETFDRYLGHLYGRWIFVGTDAELEDSLASMPRYIFFIHWSSIIPAEVLEQHECICFHMTDLPYGRGGSPLQNLIVRGHHETVVTAFRMVEALDAGPIYGRRPLSLEGAAEEIYLRAGRVSAEMIEWIATQHPTPTAQEGEPVMFSRRTASESSMPESAGLDEAYDMIRMLDADGYPHAYLDHGGLRYTFRRASRGGGRVEADVTITPLPTDTP